MPSRSLKFSRTDRFMCEESGSMLKCYVWLLRRSHRQLQGLYLTGFMGKLSSPHQTRSTARALQSPLRTQTPSPVRIFHMFTFLSAVPSFLVSTRCPPQEPLPRSLYWNGGGILKALLSTMTHLLLVHFTCFWPTSESIKQNSGNNEGTPKSMLLPLTLNPCTAPWGKVEQGSWCFLQL